MTFAPLTGFRHAILLALIAACPAFAATTDPQGERPRDLTELSPSELAELEVTSVSKKPEKRSRVAAAVHVVTAEDVRRSGARSLPEALRLAPGVQVARINSNQWAVGVRGFSSRLSRSLLVLMDGRSVYTPLFAGVYWEVQDTLLEDLERIEVVRGPGGTLWGANAVNGIVNVISRSARETQGLFIQGGGGSEERGFGAVRYGGQAGSSLAYRVYGKYFDRRPGFHADGRDFDAWHMGQAGFRADWDPGTKSSLTFQGDLYHGRAGQLTTLSSYQPPFAQTVESEARLSGGNVLARWQRASPSGSRLSAQAYYDRTNRTEASFEEARDTFDLDLQHHISLPLRQELAWGLGYRVSRGRTGGVPTIVFDPARRTDDLFSGFVQDEIEMAGDRLRLTVGAKAERNDYSGFEIQPTGRLLWQPRSRQSVWLAVSRAVRTPSRVEHDLALTAILDPRGPTFARVLGDKRFRPEKAVVYEAGYRIQAAERFTADVAAFYNRYDDLFSLEMGTIAREASPPPAHLVLPFLIGNRLEGRGYGIELAAAARPIPWWQLSGAYSHLRLELRTDPGSTDTSSQNAEGASPRHQLSLRSTMDLPAELGFDLSFRRASELPAQRVPGYSSVDARLAWSPSARIELAAVGQNLLDAQHVEFGGGSPSRTDVERGFYAQLSLRW